jgi:hypothetical protein
LVIPCDGFSQRDGQHDFDFNLGIWKTHILRLKQPLTGSKDWVELNGTVTVRKLWEGRASLEEIEADGTDGHFEGLTLFLYNPESHQWSMDFSSSGDGTISEPSVGSFKDGRGEFYDQETYNGRIIFVRIVWSDIKADSHRFEQSFSKDGGKTWEPNFVAELTRLPNPAPGTIQDQRSDVQHDFDFAYGKWKEHTSRLQHPLTGDTTWTQMDGVSVTAPIWKGRGSIVELQSETPNGRFELLGLRLYNPTAHQWNLYFANSRSGVLGLPVTSGEFSNGIGEFYDQETYNGRMIWVRFRVFPLSPDTMQSDQAFSQDAGKTWETNWINKYTRIKE